MTLSTISSHDEYSSIFVLINVFKPLIFSSVLKSLALKVLVTAYSGHFRCRAKVAYDSKSVFGFSAFSVITNDAVDILSSQKKRSAASEAICDLPLPGFPDRYK